MKTEVFVQALNDVEDKYIEEALNYKKTSGHMKLWRGIAIAACAVLAASIGFSLIGINMMKQEEKSGRLASAVSYDDMMYDEVVYEAAYEEAAYNAVYDEAAYEADYDDAAEYQNEMPLSVMNTFSDSGMISEKAEMAIATAEGAAADAAPEEAEMEEAAEADTDMQAMIIYNVNMDVQTTTFDDSSAQLEQLVTDCGGYCENSYISNNSGSYRNASYTIRVPAANLEDFLAAIPEIGTITYINRSAEDVSENYYDIQSRLTTAEAKLERLQQLMDETENMEDIITLESAISDTQWEIDNYKGSMKYYDSRISYSTVELTLKEVYEVVAEEAPMSFGEKISSAFSQGVKGFTTFIRNVAIWISGCWIWVLIVVAVVVAVVLILRKILKIK